jgi:hypothetical protein
MAKRLDALADAVKSPALTDFYSSLTDEQKDRGAPCRGIGIAKIRRKWQSQSQQARHPVDVG